MKTSKCAICAITLSLILAQIGCRANEKLADGFYIEDETGKSDLKVAIKDREGNTHQLTVNEYTNITVKAIHVYSLKPYEETFQVQINVVSSDVNWSKKTLLILVGGKPYIELGKSVPDPSVSERVKIPATIDLKVAKESEAKLIEKRLSEKFKIEEQ